MKTAACFTKGMLQLEGSLTPILVSLVRKEKGSLHMLVRLAVVMVMVIVVALYVSTPHSDLVFCFFI